MGIRLKSMAVAVAATGLLMAGGTAAQAADSGPGQPSGPDRSASTSTSAAPDMAASRVWKHVWRSAESFRTIDHIRSAGGRLLAGNNYFYCQAQGAPLGYAGYYNDWWLKTDDDSGNAGVWVSAIYLSEGQNWEPIPGVPMCRGEV